MSTHLPPSQGSRPGALPDDHGTTSRPLPRRERRAWNAATTLVGGACALLLLLAGAGTATALAMTQERSGEWNAPSAIDTVDVSADLGQVEVITSAGVERAEVTWTETGWNLGSEPEITTSGKTLRIAAAKEAEPRWGNASHRVTVTVPETETGIDLVAHTRTGGVSIQGNYDTVKASTTTGYVHASGTTSRRLHAAAETGTVTFDQVRVTDTLDAHTTTGMVEALVDGTAPKQSSITTLTGGYSISFPTAHYWYPEGSSTDVGDLRTPDTTRLWDQQEGAPHESFPSPAPTDGQIQGLLPEPGSDAAKRCKDAPEGRPCLFLVGEPAPGSFGTPSDEWTEGAGSQDRSTGDPASPSSPTSPGTPTSGRSGR